MKFRLEVRIGDRTVIREVEDVPENEASTAYDHDLVWRFLTAYTPAAPDQPGGK